MILSLCGNVYFLSFCFCFSNENFTLQMNSKNCKMNPIHLPPSFKNYKHFSNLFYQCFSLPFFSYLECSPAYSFFFFFIKQVSSSVLEKEMSTHSNILAWEFPWREKPDGLYSPGGQKRVGQDSANSKVVNIHYNA